MGMIQRSTGIREALVEAAASQADVSAVHADRLGGTADVTVIVPCSSLVDSCVEYEVYGKKKSAWSKILEPTPPVSQTKLDETCDVMDIELLTDGMWAQHMLDGPPPAWGATTLPGGSVPAVSGAAGGSAAGAAAVGGAAPAVGSTGTVAAGSAGLSAAAPAGGGTGVLPVITTTPDEVNKLVAAAVASAVAAATAGMSASSGAGAVASGPEARYREALARLRGRCRVWAREKLVKAVACLEQEGLMLRSLLVAHLKERDEGQHFDVALGAKFECGSVDSSSMDAIGSVDSSSMDAIGSVDSSSMDAIGGVGTPNGNLCIGISGTGSMSTSTASSSDERPSRSADCSIWNTMSR
eukprot:gene10802-12778_t